MNWKSFCFRSKRNAKIIEKMLRTHPVESVQSFQVPNEFKCNDVAINLLISHAFKAEFEIYLCDLKLLDLPKHMELHNSDRTLMEDKLYYTIYKMLEKWYVNPMQLKCVFDKFGNTVQCTFKFNKLRETQ